MNDQLTGSLMKRVIDLLFAGLLVVLATPILMLAALAIFLVSPGPVFYVQMREGRNGHQFKLWKLRTMQLGADEILRQFLKTNAEAQLEWQTYCGLKNDPRIIPYVGRFLRQYSIDELPQLWNVIRNDMSMVGPRPFMYDHLQYFLPKYRGIRTRVKPGLTGLAQVSGRRGHDLRKQQAFDTLYVRNGSFCLDAWILFKTPAVVLSRRGAI